MSLSFSVFYKISFLSFGCSHFWKRNGLVAAMMIGKENRKGLWLDFFPSNFLYNFQLQEKSTYKFSTLNSIYFLGELVEEFD